MRAVFGAPSHVAKTDEGFALEQYAAALKDFDERDLSAGWAHVRDTNTRGFWPPIGLLFEACSEARKERLDSMPKREVLQGRIIDGEYQPWGGACQCRRCRNKTPSTGFYRAPRAEREAADRERQEAEEHFSYELEKLPPVLRGESLQAYRRRNHLPSPEGGGRFDAAFEPGALEPEVLTPERKAQLAKLREMADIHK